MSNVSYLASASDDVYSLGGISTQVGAINTVAAKLGISAAAIAGQLAEENQSQGVGDYIQDHLAPLLSNQDLIDNLPSEAQIDQSRSKHEQKILKIVDPAFWDIGPFNFKLGKAINLILDNVNTYPDWDFTKYVGHYDLVVSDLLNQDSDLVVKLTGLYILQANAWFKANTYGGEWDNLPQVFRDALVVSFMNSGQGLFDNRLAAAKQKGLIYEPQPLLGTGAGMNQLLNASAIDQLLGTNYSSELESLSSSDFAQRAEADTPDGMAYRYALLNLRYVVLPTLDYSKRDVNGVLDLYNPNTGTGSLSEQWITDRAAMLSWKVQIDLSGAKASLDTPYTDNGAPQVYFEDKTSGTKLYLGQGSNDNRNQYIFGSDKADTIVGGNLSDRLYGMAGNDSLRGGQGNDWLEGGQGIDTYVFSSANGGDGTDVIVDPDGGVIYRDKALLAKGVYQSDGLWKSTDGKTTYTQSGNDLVISFDNGDQITVQNFNFTAAENPDTPASARQASFGIALTPKPKAVLATTTDLSKNLALSANDVSTTTTLSEGTGRVFTLFVADATDASRSILLDLSGVDASQFGLITGADQYDFSSGSVQLTLDPGQTSLTFSLTNTGDTDDSGTLSLSAQVTDPTNPDADPIISNTATIDYTAIVEDDSAPTNIITDGDDAVRTYNSGLNSDVLNIQTGYDNRAEFDMGGGNDLVAHAVNSDIINAGDGNDQILLFEGTDAVPGGQQLVHGGAGNDWIEQSDGGGTLDGDAGNDVIGNVNNDVIATVLSADNSNINWDNWDVYWQALGPTFDVVFSQGSYTLNDGVATFEGGSWGADADGNETLTPGEKFASTAGSFTAADGTQYSFSFASSGGVNGILDLYWTEGGVAKHGQVQTSLATYTPLTSMAASTLDGGDGDDLLIAGSAGSTLIGGAGADLIQGGAGNDTVYGDGGPDSGLSQTDAGNDQIALGAGDDYADGGDGDDIIIGEDGQDTIFGGRGNDVLAAGKWGAGLIDQGNGDYLDGEDGDDTLYGSSNNDILIGGAGNDTIEGEWHNAGAFGDDYIDGGDGNDTLIGEGGSDTLYGGATQITVPGHFLSEALKIEKIRLSGSSEWYQPDVSHAANIAARKRQNFGCTRI